MFEVLGPVRLQDGTRTAERGSSSSVPGTAGQAASNWSTLKVPAGADVPFATADSLLENRVFACGASRFCLVHETREIG